MKNDINLPDPLFDAMCVSTYSKNGADYTTSSLTDSIRRAIAEKGSGSEELASSMYSSWRGTIVHSGIQSMLEKHNLLPNKDRTYMVEKSIVVSFNDVAKRKLPEDRKIGGTIDLVCFTKSGSITIYDWKTKVTTQLIKEDTIKEWVLKASIYRWLLIKSGTVSEDKEVGATYVPIFMDWTKTRADRDCSINDIPAPESKIDLMSLDETEDYIHNRVTEMMKYEGKDINEAPMCTMEERWQPRPLFKIYTVDKNGELAKKCVSHSTSETITEVTEKLIEVVKKDPSKQYRIVATKTDPVRCLSWCEYSSICNWQNVKE